MKPFVSALIGIACRISQPERRHQVRRELASITTLRKAWHFAFVLRDELLRRPVTQSRYAEIFTDRNDPFGYEVKPFEFEKFEAAVELLDIARNGVCFERAWEIGCAEGVLTARLADMRAPLRCRFRLACPRKDACAVPGFQQYLLQ
jgi:hypothetical protein